MFSHDKWRKYFANDKVCFQLYLRSKGFYERFLDQIKYVDLLEGDKNMIDDYKSFQEDFKLVNEFFENEKLEIKLNRIRCNTNVGDLSTQLEDYD
jgi:hypothetical protein